MALQQSGCELRGVASGASVGFRQLRYVARVGGHRVFRRSASVFEMAQVGGSVLHDAQHTARCVAHCSTIDSP